MPNPSTIDSTHDVFGFVHPRILGTFVNISLYAPRKQVGEAQADAIDETIADEFERLEQIFSVYRPDSELERWKRGEVAGHDLSTEFRSAMSEALDWQHRSGGAFHTASAAVSDLWRHSAGRDEVPTEVARAAAVASIAADPYTIDADGVPRPHAAARWVNLNAFAKGWIVDRVVEAVLADDNGLSGLTVNAGGDLRQRGSPPVMVAVDNPLRPYDNEPPLLRLLLDNGAVATSGGARQAFRIGSQRYSHVIDPRTGLTVDRFASVTIVADDAATADVLATVIGLADTDDAVELADRYQVAAMIVNADGSQVCNRAFSDLTIT